MHGISIPAFDELRNDIAMEMADYPTRIDCVENWDRLVGERERYRTWQEVLDKMEAIEKKLSE